MNPLHLFHITNIRIMQDITNGRCGWCGTDELYVKYHDQEWGKLVTDDKTLFEFPKMYLEPHNNQKQSEISKRKSLITNTFYKLTLFGCFLSLPKFPHIFDTYF